jgi:mannan endo-1,4-beta-mannosidase
MKQKIFYFYSGIMFLFPVIALFSIFTLGCQKKSTGKLPLYSDEVLAASVATNSTTITNSAGTLSSLGNGVNIQASYFCNGDQDLGWTLMGQYPKITSVRIEMDPNTSSTVQDFARWISEANAKGKKVIATYHKAVNNGSPDPATLLEAANWWKTNYATLSAAGPFTLNLMNEWGDHTVTAAQYASAYNNAISVVRQVYSGSIICDIPGWGQEFHVAANASPSITDNNIIFSTHIYPGAYDSFNGTPTAASLDYLAAAGRPCIVGEFGSEGRGSADWSGLVDHAKSTGWTVLGWSWNGDGTKPVKMNMINPYWGDRNACGTTNYTVSTYFNTIYNKL